MLSEITSSVNGQTSAIRSLAVPGTKLSFAQSDLWRMTMVFCIILNDLCHHFIMPKPVSQGRSPAILTDFLVSVAIHKMVIDHAHSLHQGVADGGAYKIEAAFFQVLAHLVGYC